MIFKKTIEHIDQLCAQADTMILEGKNSDHIITLHLRELAEETLRKSFEKIRHKMKIGYIGDSGIGGTIIGITSLIPQSESLLENTKTIKNNIDEAHKNIQNFEQRWLSSIHAIHEADIDKLFCILMINQMSGFEKALAYILRKTSTITPRPFKK